MMTDLEDLILKEANRQGHQPNQDAIRQVGIDLAGAVITNDGLIHLPGRGVIAPADFTRSLRQSMPEAFSAIEVDRQDRSIGNTLTERYREEIAANRKQARMPDNWQEIRGRYAADSVTGQMLRERERDWR